MSEHDVVLTLEQLRHSYHHRRHEQTVLDGVDLTIRASETVGIYGPSGSGKSTLLRLASGLEAPSSGSVKIAGQEIWHRRVRRRPRRLPIPRGYVMSVEQDPLEALDPRWSIGRTLSEPMLVRGCRRNRDERARQIREQLDAVGLAQLRGCERPSELSIGQCQRIAVVRALLAEPRLLIADEPTSALDVMSRLAVAHLLREAAAGGSALLVVSHDVALLHVLCDRIYELSDARLAPVAAAGSVGVT